MTEPAAELAVLELLWPLAVAALGGLAVGFEREFSARRDGDTTRFGGVRTFLLLGLCGGLAALLAGLDRPALGAICLAGGALLVAVAYAATALRGHFDATTEVAGVVVLAAGAMAGTGQLALASGIFAVTSLVLAEKGRLHALVDRVRGEELEAALRFAVLALVVLPLLPVGPFGPGYGFRPREVWVLVLIFSGLSFAGYLALRLAGPSRGYGLAGLLGGLVSSTAVTLNFARESRHASAPGRPLALGVLAACTVLPIRLVVLSLLLNRDVGAGAALLLAPGFVVALAVVALAFRATAAPAGVAATAPPANPLRLGAAIQMALAFQVVLFAMGWMEAGFGSSGVYATAFVTGLTDLDALTYSMSRLGGGLSAALAARALAVGVVANTLFKLGLGAVVGRGEFRHRVVAGLAATALATGAALAFFR